MAKNNPHALQFNGVDSWVRIPIKPELRISNNFTLSACIYKLDNGNLPTGDILCNNQTSGYKIYSASKSIGGVIYISSAYRDISYTLTDDELNQNDYFFIHLTYDGSYMRLFLNGELVSTVSQTGNVSHSTNVPLAIGANPNTSSIDSGYTFNGIIDNVSIWNKALTPEKIKYYMNRRLDGDEEGLVGYWSLDEGQGNIAHDLSPYQNHGTIYNAEWVEGEVELKRYLPETIDKIIFNSSQKLVGDKIVIQWHESDGATKYELQYYNGTEWIIVDDNILTTSYIHELDAQNLLAQYRVRGMNDKGVSDWVISENFEVVNQSSVDSEIFVAKHSKVKGYINIIGYDESDIDSEIVVKEFAEELLNANISIEKKYTYSDLPSDLVVIRHEESDFDVSLFVKPSARMRAFVDIVAPPLRTKRIIPVKDSVVRQAAPTINYGDSHQILAGQAEEGRFISYLGFNLDIPSNVDIESARLVLNKQYETSKQFFMGIYETSDDWLEDKITWSYRPSEGAYIDRFAIPTRHGEVAIDLSDYVKMWYSSGESKSFIIRPVNYSYSDLTTFGTKESNEPPYLEVSYYEKVENAGSYRLDAEITVRAHRNRDLSAELFIESNNLVGYIDSEIELVSKDVVEDIEADIIISRKENIDVTADIELTRKDCELFIGSELIVSHTSEIDSDIEIIRKIRDSEFESELIVKEGRNNDLDSSLEILIKSVDVDIDSELIVKEGRNNDLDSSLEILIKSVDVDIDSELIVKKKVNYDVESAIELIPHSEESAISSEIVVQEKGESYTLAEIEVPRYDVILDIDSELKVSYVSEIDSEIELLRYDKSTDINSTIEIESKYGTTELIAPIVVRVKWQDEITAFIDTVRRFEVNAEVEILEKEASSDISVEIFIDDGGDYVFIM